MAYSYIREMIEKRKEYLNDLRENQHQEFASNLTASLDRTLKRMQLFKEKPEPPKEQTVQEKLLANAVVHSEDREQESVRDKLRHLSEDRYREDSLEKQEELQQTVHDEVHETNKNLREVIKQLTKIDKDLRASQGQGKGLLDHARDFFEGAGERENRRRSPRSRPTETSKRSVFKTVAEKLANARDSVVETAKSSHPGKVMGRISNKVEDLVPSALRSPAMAKIGSVGALALGAYDIGHTLSSDAPIEDKVHDVGRDVAKTAGGVIGGTLGLAGGPVGSVAGSIAGEELVDAVIAKLESFATNTELGNDFGRAAAVAMSPFSVDARESLKADYRNSIIPQFEQSFAGVQASMDGWSVDAETLADKFKDYSTALKEGGATVITSIRAGGASIFSGLADAATSLKEGAATAVGQITNGIKHGQTWEGLKVAGATMIGAKDVGLAKTEEAAHVAHTSLSSAVDVVSEKLGAVSAKYESGSRGVAAVSSGRGDAGGVSYGSHQLASSNGSMTKFLTSEEGKPFASQFTGLRPGSTEFNQAYVQIARSHPEELEAAQSAYVGRTHFTPFAEKAKAETGLDVSTRGQAVKEAMYSTAVQYGPTSNVFTQAMRGRDVDKMTDKELITRLQEYKHDTVQQYFPSSSKSVQDSLAQNRIPSETKTLLALTENAVAPSAPALTGNEPRVLGQVAPSAPALTGNEPRVSQVSPATVASAVDVRQQVAATTQVPKVSLVGAKSPINSTEVTQSYYSPSMTTDNSTSVVTGKTTPVTMINKATPAESTPVSVVNQQPVRQEKQVKERTVSRSSSNTSVIELSEIPLRIDDFGLVLLNIGHVALACVTVGLMILTSYADSSPFIS